MPEAEYAATAVRAVPPEPPSETTGAPLPPPLDGARVLSSLDALGGKLDALVATVAERLTYDRAKEAAFDRLYDELDALKRNAALENQKPVFLDLILLYDRLEQARQHAVATTGTVPADTLQSFVEELLEILARRDVTLITSTAPLIDYALQRAIGVVDVAEPGQHQQVDRIVRRGFRLGERLLRPEEVIVRRGVAAASAGGGPAQPDDRVKGG